MRPLRDSSLYTLPASAQASPRSVQTLVAKVRAVNGDQDVSPPEEVEKTMLVKKGEPCNDVDDAELSKEIVLNDVTNTGVMSALVGGFALSSLLSGGFDFENSMADTVSYLLFVLSVHACTCSALTSALVYRVVNKLTEDGAARWAQKFRNQMLLMMPMMKFGMGCAAYIVSVLVNSFMTLGDFYVARNIALAIGLGSMSTVVMTFALLQLR